MLLSKSFVPILKNNPSEAKIKSHQLMLRVGMIKQASAGIYSWLPLGFKIMKKIEEIVRQEQNKIGAQEILMPTIQSSEIWKESGRYEDYGEEMLRIKDRQNREMLYGPTNEEQVTEIFRSSLKSYKSLPQLLYHIQWKFRDEIRPRFGIMRGREFYMKDAYSFDVSDEEAFYSYNKFFLSYLRTFKRLALTAIPMAADTGPIGGNLSHEFIILADTGESKIFTDKRIFDLNSNDTELEKNSLQQMRKKYEQYYSVTDEKFNKDEFEKVVSEENRLITKGIEVGHIFYFGDKYSKAMGASVDLPGGKKDFVKMGSYGIGVSRLVGAIIEAKFDDKNEIMKWPLSVAPYDIALVPMINKNDTSALDKAVNINKELIKNNIDALIDDTDENYSSKIKKMNLIGAPYQIIIGKKSEGDLLEFKEIGEETQNLSLTKIIEIIKNKKLKLISNLEKEITLRFLKARKNDGFLNVISIFSFIGISLGVAVLIIVMSVMNGFRTELINKIVGFNSHLTIKSYDQLIDKSKIESNDLKLISQYALFSNSGEAIILKNETSKGIVLRGYQSDDFSKLEIIKNKNFKGNKINLEKNNISIGNELSFSLNLKIGDEITILSPSGVQTIIGSMPKQKTFIVTSIFNSGLAEFDNNIALINLSTLEDFFGFKQEQRNLEIYLKNPKNIEKQKFVFQKVYDQELIYSWADMNSSLFSALKVERNVMFIILSLIIIVAAFNIISGLTILVKNKTKDIAILKSIGVLNKSIVKIFFLIGIIIGTSATIFGIFLGVTFSLYVENLRQFLSSTFNISLFPEEIYFLSKMPSEINLNSILIISICSIFITIVVSIFPALKAAKLDPIKALKYE